MTDNTHPAIIYKVTITEVDYDDFDASTLIYEQVVEELDIKAVIVAVNNTPATPMKKKIRAPRSDKGKKRNLLGEVVLAEQ